MILVLQNKNYTHITSCSLFVRAGVQIVSSDWSYRQVFTYKTSVNTSHSTSFIFWASHSWTLTLSLLPSICLKKSQIISGSTSAAHTAFFIVISSCIWHILGDGHMKSNKNYIYLEWSIEFQQLNFTSFNTVAQTFSLSGLSRADWTTTS